MSRGLVVLLGATLVGAAVWLLLPSPINPQVLHPGPSVGAAGVFAENEELLRADHLPLVRKDRLPVALGTAPEGAALCKGSGLKNGKNGAIYTGLEQGTIVRLPLPDGPLEEITNTGGRPLGLACDNDFLYIADAKRGLLRWSPQKGLEAIAKCPGDKQPYFTDAVAVDPKHPGRVWFTCPSQRWSLDDVYLDALEAQPTGRLLTWTPTEGKPKNPIEGKTEEKLCNLSYANGVAVDPQGRFVLVSEFSAYRIRRLWLTGEKKGKVDVLFDNLPGLPDNLWIDTAPPEKTGTPEKQTLWVGFPVQRTPLVDKVHESATLAGAVAKLPANFITPQRHGWLVGFALDEKIKRENAPPQPGEDEPEGLAPFVRYNLHDPSGALDRVTGAVVANKNVYVTSVASTTNFVARWRLPEKEPELPSNAPSWYRDRLQQGWKPQQARIWHETPQGVDFFHIRYGWFLALERPGTEERFANATYLSSLGFIYDDQPGRKTEEILPIGFTKHDYTDPEEGGKTVKVVGTTCALCHTGRLQVHGQRYLVEGGQAMHSVASSGLGFFAFTLAASMLETSVNPFKFDRFARRVLCPNGVPCDQYPAGKEALRRSVWRVFRGMVEPLARQFGKYENDEGPGRIDAFGHIANTVFGEYLKNQKNVQDARAPVDIVNVWDSWRFDYVQWTSTAGQAMGRNVGEAAFGGSLQIVDEKGRLLPQGERFGSAILIPEIYCLETTLESLEPPRWPKEWGIRDQAKFDKGRVIFEDRCAGCHRQKPYDKENQPSPDKDQEWMIKTPDVHTDLSALSAQTSARYDLSVVKPGAVSVSAIEGLSILIPSIVNFQYDRLGLSPADRRRYNGFGRDPEGQSPRPYHARPLHGIWATPPFLHNGSVPSLYELLLPADRRSKRFWLGPNQEYDIQKLGFTDAPGPGSVQFDTTRPGNGNMGHDNYGKPLSEDEIYQLLEYLKFLGRWNDYDPKVRDPDARPEKPKDLDARLAKACHPGLQGPAGESAP